MDFPVIRCITGAQKCSNGVVLVCVGISITFIASLVMKNGGSLVGVIRSVGVEFCIVLL